MSTYTASELDELVYGAFGTPGATVIPTAYDEHFKVEVHIGSQEITFEYGRDCAWRLVGVSNYGNHNFVSGPGCDASGFVIRDMDVCETLDELFA